MHTLRSVMNLTLHPRTSFALVAGTTTVLVSLIGLVLCSIAIFCIVARIIYLTRRQNIFLLNVLINDLLIGMLGVIRGVGILWDQQLWFKTDGSVRAICEAYPLLAKLNWHSVHMVLIPLTVDRFIAVMFPLKHGVWITTKVGVWMVLVPWVLVFFDTGNTTVQYLSGGLEVVYIPEYHRCSDPMGVSALRSVMFFIVPMGLISTMYLIMLAEILQKGRSCRKLLLTSSTIVFCSLLIVLPSNLHEDMGMYMSHRTSMVLNVMLYYHSSMTNPLIYLLTNRIRNRTVRIDNGHGWETVRGTVPVTRNVMMNMRDRYPKSVNVTMYAMAANKQLKIKQSGIKILPNMSKHQKRVKCNKGVI